jgi:subtilisin family serine protease
VEIKIKRKSVFAALLLSAIIFSNAPLLVRANETVEGLNTIVVQLQQNDPYLFADDFKIKQIKTAFPGSKVPAFQSTYKLETEYSVRDIKSKYAKLLVYAEEAREVSTAGLTFTELTTINDPGFSSDDSDEDKQWGLHRASFTEAWDKTRGSVNVTVAILDTGIDGTHEDLSAGQVSNGYDFISRTLISAGLNSDDNGHGTMVAGVIGATSNNFRGITGANWNVRMMPLKALDSRGSGNSADVAAAIVWASDHGASIINMSLGGPGFGNDTTLSNAINYAFGKGVLMVAAAGNDAAISGGNLDQNPMFPICSDTGDNMIIGVVATDINDQKGSFSNYGKACVDVSAPGKHILSTINYDPVSKSKIDNAYAYASGTSLATPFVSAEAALIKALYPNSTNKEIRDRIIKGSDPIDTKNPTQCGGSSCSGLIGSGRINVYQSLQENLINKAVSEGDIVQADNSSTLYLISGGKKLPISEFVKKQQFQDAVPKVVPSYFLDNTYALGPFVAPRDGTLIKNGKELTVYEMIGGIKRPVTYQIFMHRGYSFLNVNLLSDQEMNSWVTGTFLPPLDGTRLKNVSNPTQYWVVTGVLHPVNYGFYLDRGLSIFPLMVISDNDLKGFAQGNAYIR